VSSHRDSLISRTSHLKDGLNRLFSLVPYEIITSDIWDYVMPYWMEAIVNDVPEKELHELKNLLRSAHHLPFQFVHYCLHPHVASCVFRTFHKLVVYRKDSNKAQVVITIHFTVFKRNVIAVASNLTIFSEYRTVLAIRFHTPSTVSLVKIVPIFNFMD